MKYIRLLFLIGIVTFFTTCKKDTLNNILNQGLSQEDAVNGLKDALKVGTGNTVSLVSIINGYYGNSLIKIPFPEDATFIVNAVNTYIPTANPLIDTLVLKLNRAAENAAIKAKPIFINAITGMTIGDAFSILKGGDTAATHYLRINTYSNLFSTFKPDIDSSLTNVGATQIWKEVTTYYNSIPDIPYVFTKQQINTDLPAYTTGKALKGLFLLIGNEEKSIRKDPAKRVDDLLKKVFSEENTTP
ncbi:MAG: DUF4197 domain-containing protein [Bacteroidota bacterium]|nr:DUF4197 domain-containing protein [Bacteroidota bacterium]